MDVFWGRETSNVRDNLNLGIRDYEEAKRHVVLEDVYPECRDSSLRGWYGMRAAVMTLNVCLRPGRYAHHLQWDFMRQTQTAFGNFYNSHGGSPAGTVLGKVEMKMVPTRCPTLSDWFSRFKKGMD